MTSVYLADRALRDINEIAMYSAQSWGQRVATKYIADLDSAFSRLASSPGLLQERLETSLRLRFYFVREHVLVCDLIGEHIFVLAVRHAVMDLPRRIAELEPLLVHEAELLARRIEERNA